MEAHLPCFFSVICPISPKAPSSGPVDGMLEWMDFDHLEMICYLPFPRSKLHLWLHLVIKLLLLWLQTSPMALPFPSWAFSVARTNHLGSLGPAFSWSPMKQKFIHIFSYRDEKVPDKVWRARRVKTGKREKERTQKSTYVY